MERNERIRFINQKRSTIKSQITILTNAIDNDRLDCINVNLRFERIKEHFKNYEELHDELELIEPNGDHFEEMLEVQDRFYNLASRVHTILNQNNSSAAIVSDHIDSLTASQNERMKRIKLPIAQLPGFSGEIENWLSYKNTFVTLIDSREDITDLQKFLYLKDSLKGEALNKISIYDTSDASYKLAWNLLVESYEKKRIIINKHLDAILDIPNQTRFDGKELNKLIDNMKQHVNMLDLMDVKIDETMLVRILERSIPLNIRARWEESLGFDEMPSLNKLYKFLASAALRIDNIEKEKTRKRMSNGFEHSHGFKMKKSNFDTRIMLTTTSRGGYCSICRDGMHSIFRCPKYDAMNIEQRWDKVKQLRVCQNCLRVHERPCKSIKCKICNRFHHTSLHKRGIIDEKQRVNISKVNDTSNRETIRPGDKN
ncbi:uncharacterized protein [Prorops nasuta]|uniref:uncharacterized protein n=1 Tax=Prorops nasuta TaxID=863751 RepID=UPI0034CF2953